MQSKRKLVSLVVLAALLVLLVAPAATAQFTPLIYTVDQEVVDGVFNVSRVTSDGPGWAVVHADDAGNPGPVLGHAAVPAGIGANVKVELDTSTLADGDTVHVLLYVDAGTEGTFEVPGADVPAEADGEPVSHTATITAVGSSLARVAAEQGLATLLEGVEAAGLTSELATGGPYTLFAPSDEAFAAVPADELGALLADPEALSNVLLYHLVPDVLTSDRITESVMLASAQGAEVDVQVGDDGITVNGAAVETADIEAYNGVIHIIDSVLMPPVEEEAPTEEATAEPALEPAETMVNLVDALREAGTFNTALSAVEAAGLEDALSGVGPFTLFAPTDDAFAALPEGTLDSLLADPAGDLTQLLLYHVVPGQIAAADVQDGQSAETLQGDTLSFAVDADGNVTVNGVAVVRADIAASNGVIHAIEGVLTAGEAAAAGEEAAEATAEPAAEATAEPATESAAEATAEPAAESAAEATPEPAAEPATESAAAPAGEKGGAPAGEKGGAPAELPVTGEAQSNSSLPSLAVAGLVLLMLAVTAFLTRRRTA